MRIHNQSSFSFTSVKTLTKSAKRIKNVHILDGGEHSMSMIHYAKAIMGGNKNIDLALNEVGINTECYDVKRIDSILEVLNSLSLQRGDFVSIPALVSVSLSQIQDFLNQELKSKIRLTPNNLISYKNIIIDLLRRIHNSRQKYENKLWRLDMHQQNYTALYPLIKKINELTKNGVNVYIPINPDDYPIKSEIDPQGLRNRLYSFIATGKDDDFKVREAIERAKKSNNYNFNMLTLADAHIVDVTNANGEKYIYSARDGFVNDSEFGVHNFTPIRNSNGDVEGFSFHDETTIEYRASEFPGFSYIQDLLNFVGLSIRDLIASAEEHEILKKARENNQDIRRLPNKLYKISDILESVEIDSRQMNVLGDFMNKEEDLVFDVNSKGQILFQKTNCEGTERPSVVSMWGPCFSTIKAIERDIEKSK